MKCIVVGTGFGSVHAAWLRAIPNVATGLLHYSGCADKFGSLRLNMPRPSPFKHHRFPRDIILCAVRWYLRYPLSYRDVVDLLAERGITVDRSTVYRWVQNSKVRA